MKGELACTGQRICLCPSTTFFFFSGPNLPVWVVQPSPSGLPVSRLARGGCILIRPPPLISAQLLPMEIDRALGTQES